MATARAASLDPSQAMATVSSKVLAMLPEATFIMAKLDELPPEMDRRGLKTAAALPRFVRIAAVLYWPSQQVLAVLMHFGHQGLI